MRSEKRPNDHRTMNKHDIINKKTEKSIWSKRVFRPLNNLLAELKYLAIPTLLEENIP